jgi:hypothetical protein
MQSTVREHRDGGHAGGLFQRYTIVKVNVNYFTVFWRYNIGKVNAYSSAVF